MTQDLTKFAIGEDLYGVSIEELHERISVLKEEISRLERELEGKTKERDAAEKLFGKKS